MLVLVKHCQTAASVNRQSWLVTKVHFTERIAIGGNLYSKAYIVKFDKILMFTLPQEIKAWIVFKAFNDELNTFGLFG
jgi:hypothetical protein